MQYFHDHGFAHQRLDVYRVALELVQGVARLTRALPTGTAELKDQLMRSALATVRHLAEGANRVSPADRRARFTVARGEVAEADATLETLALLEFAPLAEVGTLRDAAHRVGAMLGGLIRRETQRVLAPPA